ncbi:MAG: RNA-binding protein [Methanomassiliicoccales archaeon]|nr:RNA-binding protein [Methanomassiliicoccales archaeon]
MSELRVRKRRRLREKEIKALAEEISSKVGAPVFQVGETVDMAEGPGFDVVLVSNQIVAFVLEGKAFLTVRGFLKYPVSKAYATVDMGAIKFVINGADVMGPGIVDADESIAVGDYVWVRDEKNLKPLAVGVALTIGAEMRSKKPGKAIRSLFYVGDKLWKYDER